MEKKTSQANDWRRDLAHVTLRKLCLYFEIVCVSIQVLLHTVKDREGVEKEERLPWSRRSVIRGLEERHPWSK